MNKVSRVFLFVFIGIITLNLCFGLDWINLHNQADKTNLEQARKDVLQNPDSIPELYTLALTYLNQYNAKEAKKSFEKILNLDPSNLLARWGQIESLRRLHQCSSCIKELENIIKKRPDFAPAYITLAYLYYTDMNFEKTSKLCYKVIKMGKDKVDSPNYLRALGLFAGAKGMIAHYGGPLSKVINGRSVMPYLEKAKKIDPDSPIVYFGLGSYYMLIPPIFGRNLEKSEKYLKKAIKADPKFADVYVRLAQVYRAQGDEDKYNKYISKALDIDPQNKLALDIKTRKCDFICIN
ncbi:MAG: tetratricopeptide repeat protein [Candidatus Omnitrophica bacterium]|nr:tetratricopeptide repeat protein [Candidatus Omnitrophota bacterium]MCF7898256.1 tetratricopeptide repeat protein [Candidatus Omnitrophota bacterium]